MNEIPLRDVENNYNLLLSVYNLVKKYSEEGIDPDEDIINLVGLVCNYVSSSGIDSIFPESQRQLEEIKRRGYWKSDGNSANNMNDIYNLF